MISPIPQAQPLPVCAVCKRPVEEMVALAEDGLRQSGFAFVVRCHGAEERFVIERELVDDLGPNLRIEMNEAFVPCFVPALAAGAEREGKA